MHKEIYGPVPYNNMSPSAKRVRDFYAMRPGAPIYREEFGYYVLDRWIREGHLKPRDQVTDYGAYLGEIFGFDKPAINTIYGLGSCEAAFLPEFETRVLEDRGNYELVQDFAGRALLCFKGRRDGFMPEYVDHPVKDMATWERDVAWRMDPDTPGRMELTRASVEKAKKDAEEGNVVVQLAVGGYMYLRSLIGPGELLYKFYDDPDLIHACMQAWYNLADKVIERHQQVVAFDALFLSEDICYNHGALISPAMMEEFLLPYYRQLYANMKKRNLDQTRKIHLQVDTDGRCHDVIDIYASIGCDYMSPFEVASGCDVVELGRQYPNLLIRGGIDKRIIAKGGDDIKRHLAYIMPAMRARGGYIPVCDHGVPEEVTFENYMFYRKLMLEYCG